MKSLRPLLLVLSVLLLLVVGAAPAQATLLVRSDTGGLLVQDKNGLGDRVNISSGTQGGNPVYVITNANPFDVFKFDRQANCSAGATDETAVCKKVSGRINLAMVGGDDVVETLSSGASTTSVNLGTGNDTFGGGGGADDVFAAGGDDEVNTRGGNDEITYSDGFDRVDAGTGDDTVDDGDPPSDGRDDFISLGPGNDTANLSSSFAHIDQTVNDGPGNDVINTGSGEDGVVAGTCDGLGMLSSASTGADTISTRNGDDSICSKESGTAVKDNVACGFGTDRVEADLQDDVDAIGGLKGGTCEEVDRSPVGETPHVRIGRSTLRVRFSRRTRVRLRCPRGVGRLGCKGRLQLRLARGRRGGVQARSRRVRYSIRAGRRKTVTLRLSRSDVRTLRRRQRRGRRTRGILTSVERGRLGRKTTVRNPRLRLR